MNDRRLPMSEQLERILYTKDGDKYDHRQDPNDVTGLLEADPQLREQMERLGYAVRWAIDGRWRLTPRGQKEMARRREEAAKERQKNSVGPLHPEHEYQARRFFEQEAAQEAEARNAKLGGSND